MKKFTNTVTLCGNLGQDPTMFRPDSPEIPCYVTVPIATNEVFETKKGRIEETNWHRCVIKGKVAEKFKAMCSVGDKVLVTGRLTYRSYTGKNGEKVYVTEIMVSEFVITDKKR